MNGPVQDGFAEAFRELRDAFGVPITFGVVAVSAVVSESQLSRELTEGGFQAEAEFIARVLLADLPATPSLGSLVIYNGRAFKVAKAAVQPGHPVGEFTLTPKNR